MPTLNELIEKRNKVESDLKSKLDSLTKDEKGAFVASDDDLSYMTQAHTDLNDIGEKIAAMESGLKLFKDKDGSQKWAKVPVEIDPEADKKSFNKEAKTLGNWVGELEGKNFAQFGGQPAGYSKEFDMDPQDWLTGRKTVMTTSGGYIPEVLRDGDHVAAVSRPIQIMDMLQFETTTQNAISYMQQGTRTNNTAATAEGSALPEDVIAWSNVTSVIRDIGSFIPITQNELDDAPQVRALVDYDLVLMVRQVMESQIVAGSGSGQNLTGILASGIQTQAKSSDTAIDAFAKAVKLVSGTSAYCNANIIAAHVDDYWSTILSKDSQNRYLLVDPGAMPRPMLWGRPFVQCDSLTQGTALVFDSNYFKPVLRRGVVVETGWQNDDFVKRQLTLRAYCRLGLKIRRGVAAAKVTGL